MKEKEEYVFTEDIGINVLKQVKEVLDKHGVEYWLNQGTLLGAVRDGKFIPWDGDIDLSTWQGEAAKIASAHWELIDSGFMGCSYKYRDGTEEYYIIKEGCHVDIVLYRLNNDKATRKAFITKRAIGNVTYHLLWILSIPPYVELNPNELRIPFITMNLFKITRGLPSSWRERLAKIAEIIYEKIGSSHVQMVVPSHYYTNLSTITFYGMEFKVPAETEEYLIYKYGRDWNIPNRNWKWMEEDGAIVHDDEQSSKKVFIKKE